MEKVYIKNYGVHQQFATNSAALSQLLATEEEINPHDLDYYNFSTPSVLEKNVGQQRGLLSTELDVKNGDQCAD